MQGYEIQSPAKEIWLPLDYGWISEWPKPKTLQEFTEMYREKYGIDISELIALNERDKEIAFIGNISAYAIDNNYLVKGQVRKNPILTNVAWISGEANAQTYIMVAEENSQGQIETAFGLSFEISKDSSFSKENITVTLSEI